jgi:hypothetical protein
MGINVIESRVALIAAEQTATNAAIATAVKRA